MDLPVGFLVCLHCNLRIQFRIWFWYVLSMWDPHWSSLSCSWKFSPYSKAQLYDWFSHSMGIKRPWQLVSHSSLRWKMHGNRRNHYDPYLTTAKHVDTACRCNRSLPFASDLFLSVLPQILILYHCIWIYWCSHRNCDTVCIRRRYFQYKLAGHPQRSRMGTRILRYATYPGSFHVHRKTFHD